MFAQTSVWALFLVRGIAPSDEIIRDSCKGMVLGAVTSTDKKKIN